MIIDITDLFLMLTHFKSLIIRSPIGNIKKNELSPLVILSCYFEIPIYHFEISIYDFEICTCAFQDLDKITRDLDLFIIWSIIIWVTLSISLLKTKMYSKRNINLIDCYWQIQYGNDKNIDTLVIPFWNCFCVIMIQPIVNQQYAATRRTQCQITN